MTIRAVLRKGIIQPTEPLPSGWAEGQELVVEEPQVGDASAKIDQWAREIEATAAQLPREEHDRFRQALDQIERESKETVLKQWETP
jgi:hypothetical protein